MRRFNSLLALILFALFSCGFTWGFGKGDHCSESTKAVEGVTNETLPAERAKIEKKILSLCPDGGAAHYLKGLALGASNKSEQAISEYRDAISKEPLLADAYGQLGLLMLKKGVPDEASVNLYNSLKLKRSPSYAKALADLYLEGKFYGLALLHYEQTMPVFANDVSVQNGMGQCYLGQGNLVKAREKFQTVLHLQPANELSHLKLAEIYQKEKQYDQAIAELRLSLAANPGNRDSHYRLAQFLEMTGNSNEASNEYKLAGVERSVDPSDHMQRAASFTAAGAYDKAANE
ncbi:tetratricopeptide repeat protein [Pelotalea chapellei]|uniref:Tetratricopeptide repeat protein n=1 Tax=Pelotalea chapellei TaxID=44671 RepID=A0ABS5UAG6_9BACT|nr:tetratricopeptide repeat protein [Pelotalea chapellei]MBT1072671.1 tetratricopeptide repeat protein [Pelotalea chapellei]